MKRVFSGLVIGSLGLAGCEGEGEGGAGTEGDCEEAEVGDDGSGVPQTVTLGVYELVDGCYIDQDKDLTMSLGTPCHSWSRTTKKPDEFSDEPHLHYNAADDMAYDQVTFSWTEYGPEHSQEDIDATCAGGSQGTAKEAWWDEYVEEPPGSGAWLRIKSVTY